MKIKIYKSVANGTIAAPPSKSIAHRALICGALGGGKVYNIKKSKDILATLGCLKSLGAEIKEENGAILLKGFNPQNFPENALLDCFESGSTLRFFLPICMLSGKKCTFYGSSRLLSRPLDVYEEICKQENIEFSNDGEKITVCGKLSGGEYSVRGDISSQFITGLLFALPLCSEDSTLTVTGAFESASYIDLTLSVLKDFGIDIKREGNVFYIKGGQKYHSCEYTVEGDCSNAAFLDAFNFLGGKVEVTGLNPSTMQGDRIYKDIFPAINSRNTQFDLSDCPDLAPVLFSLSAALGGATFTGTKRLKIKESDRASAMKQELSKFGIDVIIKENSVTVCGGTLRTPTESLCSHNDHRIVMALSLLCTLTGGEIEGAEAVEKSYPEFFEDIKELGVLLEEI